jgi:hypothetical protein
MSNIYVNGCGAVSPAGWGLAPLRAVMADAMPLPSKTIMRPGWERLLKIRQVPTPDPRPAFLAHARLRRTSPITQYVVSAALEALGGDAPAVKNGTLSLGIVLCAMSGCVNYTRRFYDEALRDPATASPLIFPETVFNAPASHLATLLGTPAMNYTIIGDPGTYLQGLALGAQWLVEGRVDGCLVVGAEECDWLTSDAFRHFSRQLILSEGAGAVYLKRDTGTPNPIELKYVTEPCLFTRGQRINAAAKQVRAKLPASQANHLLADGLQNITQFDAAETSAWRDWTGGRLSAKTILGEGLMAAAAWQCVLAIDALKQERYAAASVSVVGCNQQAIGAHFINAAYKT